MSGGYALSDQVVGVEGLDEVHRIILNPAIREFLSGAPCQKSDSLFVTKVASFVCCSNLGMDSSRMNVPGRCDRNDLATIPARYVIHQILLVDAFIEDNHAAWATAADLISAFLANPTASAIASRVKWL